MLVDVPLRRRSSSVFIASLCLIALAVASVGCQDSAAAPQDEKDAAESGASSEEGEAEAKPADVPEHPFPRRLPAPSFDPDAEWLNTAGPLELKSLHGKFVLLDFWTYCCINCMHILPELKELEHKYAEELVVIGVHSAKFETEKQTENIREAILRYEIEHPVVNDAEQKIWNKYFVRSWPSLRVIDPEGNIVAGHSGEITFEALDAFLQNALPYYEKKGVLDRSPLRFNLEVEKAARTPLRYPGKVLADGKGKRLFIADSNHNRIVITDLNGKLLETIGSGAIGSEDGDYSAASFDHPQGMALLGETLYVADTENHLLRKVDLKAKQVTTIAGTGEQARRGWPGLERLTPGDKEPRWYGPPLKTALNSPWALVIHGEDLYIAMAGPHQIWRMPLSESEIGIYAGNGREDIVDGPLVPPTPYEKGYCSFAQPSGLATDGEWLYVADSEGSSIRAVPLKNDREVRTVVGTADLPGARLFIFGDRDGTGKLKLDVPLASFRGEAGQTAGPLLQHVLGVVYHDGLLYVADTYNNKLKAIEAETGETKTLVGTGEPGKADDPAQFDEPAGLSYAAGKLYVADTNNHRIRVVDLEQDHAVSTLEIAGLEPPSPKKDTDQKPTFPGAKTVRLPETKVKPADGKIALDVQLKLPPGWKINPLAPQRYLVEVAGEDGPIRRDAVGKVVRPEEKQAALTVSLPVSGSSGSESLKLSLEYFYCQSGAEGLCRVGAVVWEVPLEISSKADSSSVELAYKVPE